MPSCLLEAALSNLLTSLNIVNLAERIKKKQFWPILQSQMQNGMMPGGGPHPGHQHHHPQQGQLHHMHPPQASPLDSQGGHSPTSSNTSQTPQTTPTSSSGGGGGPGAATNSREVPKICGRPGCNNPVQRSPDGWQSDFCSNECVVGQCREVYSSWSAAGSQQQHQPPGPQHQHPGAYHSMSQPQSHPQQPPQQAQVQTAAVKWWKKTCCKKWPAGNGSLIHEHSFSFAKKSVRHPKKLSIICVENKFIPFWHQLFSVYSSDDDTHYEQKVSLDTYHTSQAKYLLSKSIF